MWKTNLGVLIILVFVASLVSAPAVQARNLGELIFGSDEKLHQAPMNTLDIGVFYRDTVEPCPFPETLVYHLQEKDGINAVLPDMSMPVPITGRPMFAIAGGLIMTGQPIGRIWPAASMNYVKVIVPASNGWEDQGEWLYDAIKQARVCAGLEADLSKLSTRDRQKARELAKLEARQRGEDPRSDPGPFPPFIAVPAETAPRINGDGSISFGKAPMSLPLLICAPVSNLIPGAPQSISLFVSVNKKSYAGAVIGFKTARPDQFMIPKPAAGQTRTSAVEPPVIGERVIGVTPPPATRERSAPAGDRPMPWQVEKFVYSTAFGWNVPASHPWWKPGYVIRNNDAGQVRMGETGFVTVFVRKDGTVMDSGPDMVMAFDGQPYRWPNGTLQTSCGLASASDRPGIVYHHAPLGAKVDIAFTTPEGRTFSANFTAPTEASDVMYWPVFEN